MKLGIFSYSYSRNLGDEVQALAVAQHVDEHQIVYVDRDHLNTYYGEKCVVVMNGWFSAKPENFPPSPSIVPIFFGFHMTDAAVAQYKQHAGYFKQHEPIGCRDEGTTAIMRSWGVDAYFSGCATMTFARRTPSAAADQTFVMDVSKKKFAKALRKELCFGSQDSCSALLSIKTKFDLTRELLELYRNRAKAVITSRIHCAMPCAAMGIPVLYVGPRERRTKVIEHLGIPILKTYPLVKIAKTSFPVMPVEIEDKKKAVAADLRARLSAKNIRLVEDVL